MAVITICDLCQQPTPTPHITLPGHNEINDIDLCDHCAHQLAHIITFITSNNDEDEHDDEDDEDDIFTTNIRHTK